MPFSIISVSNDRLKAIIVETALEGVRDHYKVPLKTVSSGNYHYPYCRPGDSLEFN